MLVVETIAKIRRLHLVEGRPIKAICRELGLSRKVVRKVLRSGATEFRYERTRQPLPKLGPWQAELDRLLEENAARPGRERLTLVRVFEALRGLGYAGGGSVAKFAVGREWLSRQADQAATSNSSATKMAWARMSRPPILRTCPFLTIAITS